jgi:hypothetical protein
LEKVAINWRRKSMSSEKQGGTGGLLLTSWFEVLVARKEYVVTGCF